MFQGLSTGYTDDETSGYSQSEADALLAGKQDTLSQGGIFGGSSASAQILNATSDTIKSLRYNTLGGPLQVTDGASFFDLGVDAYTKQKATLLSSKRPALRLWLPSATSVTATVRARWMPL